MNNKDKIHKYPIMQSNPYGNNEDFISQKDFYQILCDTKYCTPVTAKEFIKQDTRHFAKRQLTWFRREPSVTWVDFSQIRREDALSYMLEQLKEKEII